MEKIMIIEDNQELFLEIKSLITDWGFDAVGINDFNNVLQIFIEEKPSLIIIDINLPLYNGFHWCKRIRSISKVPILFLSSRKDPKDIIMSMELGADDYIEKPFNFEVLIAKINALMRRSYTYTPENKDTEIILWNECTVNFNTLSIQINEIDIKLTKNESLILKILLKKKGTVVNKEEIINTLWRNEEFISESTLAVNINRLRKKLREYGIENYIETKFGIGYIAKE